MKNLKIIDAHCHIYPDKIAQKASDHTGDFYSMPSLLDGKTSTLLEYGEKAGIEHFVVQSVATTPSQVSSINNFIANSVCQSNGKFTGLGTLHPDSDDIEADISEIINLGLKGVKLHPDIQQFKIDDYRMLKIYELCEDRLPILMHTGDSRFDYSNPNRMKPILEIYTKLTVIGAHLGGWSMWDRAVDDLKGYKNFYVDCSSSLYAISPKKATEVIRAYGADRVMFATDYPMWSPKQELERFYALDLSKAEQEQILYKTAEKLFKLKL